MREARDPARRRAPAGDGLAGQPPARRAAGQLPGDAASTPQRGRGAAPAADAARAGARPRLRAADSRDPRRFSADEAARRCGRASRRRPERTRSVRHSPRRTSRRCSISISTSCATRVQTGPTPGFTFFPHVGTLRIEGPFNAAPAKDSPSRARIFVCRPTSAADEAACAREDHDEPRHARVQASGVQRRRPGR